MRSRGLSRGLSGAVSPRPEGKLIPIAYRIAPRGRLNERDLMSPPPLSRRGGAAGPPWAGRRDALRKLDVAQPGLFGALAAVCHLGDVCFEEGEAEGQDAPSSMAWNRRANNVQTRGDRSDTSPPDHPSMDAVECLSACIICSTAGPECWGRVGGEAL